MKKIINKIKDRIEVHLRSICAPMDSGRRVVTIVALIIVFAAVNFYITFKAIYNIGREDKIWELIDSPIVIPDVDSPEEKPAELQKGMEDFFNEQIKPEKNDTTTKE